MPSTAAVLAALAVALVAWFALPPSVSTRLGPPARRWVPSWARPVDGAPRPEVRWGAGCLAGIVAAGALAPIGWLAWLGGAFLGVGCWWGLGRVAGSGVVKEAAAVRDALPEICALLAVAAEAGLPLSMAVTVLCDSMPDDVARQLRLVRCRLDLGYSEASAWEELADHPQLGVLARELSRTAGTGVSLVAVLKDLAAEARRSSESEAVVAARRVGVWSVLPLMVCFLPAFVLIGVVPIVGATLGHVLG